MTTIRGFACAVAASGDSYFPPPISAKRKINGVQKLTMPSNELVSCCRLWVGLPLPAIERSNPAERPHMATFCEQIAEHARQSPEREALVDETCTILFGDMPGLIEKYQACLLQAGVLPGSTVGLTIRRQIPHLLVSLALLKSKAHQVTLASHETEYYRQSLVRRLNLSHRIYLDDSFDVLNPTTRHFQLTQPSQTEPAATASPDVNLYSTTSGTTKGPRIFAIAEQILAAQAARDEQFLFERVCATASVEHVNPKRIRLRCLYVGATSVFYRNVSGAWTELADYATKNGVTMLMISTSDAPEYINAPRQGSRLRASIHIAGTRIPWALRKSIQENLSGALYVRYGASECGLVSVAGPGEHDERESVGRPLPGVTVEIVDAAGAPLPREQVGEIRIRGTGISDSYYDDADETAARFRDGWFYPGDMASMTNDGQLIIQGRKDDMMIMNSINIYPSEIERVFEAHPGVSAVAAFPIKSRIHGDIPAVAVELKKGSVITENALMDYCRDRLGIRYPRKIFFVEDMPKSPMGKVLKNELAALVSQAP